MVVRPEKPRTSFLTAQDLFLTVKTPAVVKVGVAGVARVQLDVRSPVLRARESQDGLTIRVSGYKLGHINPTATAVYGVVVSELINGLKLRDFSVVG